jgi:hypothetical protein
VKVLNSKGIANQTGPESCVAHREVRDEALVRPAGRTYLGVKVPRTPGKGKC